MGIRRRTGYFCRFQRAEVVSEYWLVDARKKQILFHIYRRGSSQYEPASSDDRGYQYSEVLRAWYRLDRRRNASNRTVFDLAERTAE